MSSDQELHKRESPENEESLYYPMVSFFTTCITPLTARVVPISRKLLVGMWPFRIHPGVKMKHIWALFSLLIKSSYEYEGVSSFSFFLYFLLDCLLASCWFLANAFVQYSFILIFCINLFLLSTLYSFAAILCWFLDYRFIL